MTKRIKHINWTRVISAILCFVLLVGSLPLSVFAETLDTNESSAQQTPVINNLSSVQPSTDDTELGDLLNTVPSDYPQNATDVLDVRLPQTVGVSTERPASFANNTATLTYESGYTGAAASGFNSGTGTQADPYIIKTGAQLKYFANQVNAGNTYSGKYIKLDANINLNGKDWTPIGYSQSRPFSGVFDGNYHEIKNMKITYSSGKALDNETFYIGFWGYVNNATIKNIGIADYTVNQTYSFHTVIGGFVAYADGTSATSIQNCYANGNVTTNFGGLYYVGMTKTLKGQSNVYSITSVDSIPADTDAITQPKMLIDLSSVDSCDISKTLTIGSNISTIQFIGKADAIYSNFNIVIASGTSDINLIFEDFNLIGNSSSGAIYSAENRQINLYTCGTSNSITSSVAAPALNIPNASTTIMGKATITFSVTGHGAAGAYPGKAGNGKHGSNGNSGSSGSAGMIANNVLIYADDVVCIGGQGGAGSKGGQGNSSTWKTARRGGNGGNGGTGGAGLQVSNLGIIYGSFKITGGKGGTGGQGGTPGAFGTAGTGGTGGTGGTALVISGSVYGIEPYLVAGAGGDRGERGLAGGVDTGSNGSYGSAGAGGSTSSPATYSVIDISEYTFSPLILDAILTIGGFVGIATGNTNITNSTVVIDSITIPSNYPNTSHTEKWFVAQNNIPTNSGKIDAVLTLKTNGETYTKYTEGDSFGGTGTKSTSSAIILTGYVDGQNVTYATGINSAGEYNDVIETIVVGKTGSKCDVVIPESVYAGRFIMPVVAIDNGAFWNNTTIQNVTLGKNITTIGEAAFMGSSIVSFNDFDRTVIVGNRAFAKCTSLTVADLSNAKEIGEVAFYGCSALTSVSLGDNLTEIKKGVFYNCSKLSTIIIPKNITTIGISSFFGSGLKTVDYSKATALTLIKDSAFANSTALVEAVIPNAVQTIEPCAYYGCTAITSISIGTNVKTIGEASFYNCSSLENAIVPVNVTSIGASSFGGCSKLKSITVPFVGSTESENDKTYFGYIFGAGTYKGNDDVVPATLTNVTVLSGAQKIDEYAFCWCANIKTVCLPDTITSIGKYAFCSCGLTETVVPDSVDVIGFAAFENCKQIKQITLPFVGADDDFDVVTDDKETQNIDTHLGYIFGAQFYQTNDSAIPDNLSVVVSNNATKIAENAFYGCNRMVSITLGENITIIGSKAFFDCNGISTISVPDSVTAIGKEAFGRSDTSQKGNLTTVTIGNGVEIIEEKILVGRSEVETINIGSSVKTFKDLELKNPLFGIDKNTSSLKKYDVSLDNTAYKTVDGVLYELFELKDINGVSSQYLTVAVVDVPSNVNISQYEPLEHVVRIYANAFSHNKTIESVKLDYIREIGDAAFFNATNLKTVEFGTPDEFFVGTNGNWFIKEYVYDEETNSTNIQERDTGIVASNTQRPYVGDDNYWYVGEVNIGIVNLFRILDEEYKIKIEQYSQNIGTNAFKGCSSLSNVNLESEYISKIGASAFADCATAINATPLNIVLGRNITILAAGYEELYNKDKEGNNALRDFFSVFSGSNVASFDVVEGNSKFFAHDGVLYFKTGGVINEKEELWLIAYPSNKSMNLDVEKGTELPFEVPSFDTMIVTRVAKNSFNGAKYLKEVVIGNGVETVDDTAFVNTDIVSITFGDSVLYIGSSYDGTSHMFDDCNSLFYIKVDENNPKYSHVEGVLFNKDQTELIKYPQMKVGLEYSVPGTVSTVYGNAFAGNKNLRRVSFESPITYIGNRAFYGCSNLSMVYFKRGDAPFNRTELQKDKNGLFLTNNPTTTPIVCYGESTSNWDLLTDIYTNDEGVAIYAIEPFNGLASSEDVSNGYYAIVVLDNEGNPLNHVSVELGESVATIGKNSLSETVKTQAGIAMFLNPSYDVPYKLSVVDNNGQYFPYENTEFYLDKETRVTYIALSAVPTVLGVSVSYENTSEKVKDKLNSVLTSTSNILLAGVESGTFDINSETVKINKWLIDEITLKVNCGIDTNAEILGLKLFQGGDYIDEQYITINQSQPQTIGGKKFVTIEITIATEHLKQEEDVYVSVETSSGIVQTKLNVQIIEFAITDVDLSWISEGIDFDVDQDISALLKGVDKIDIITGQKYFPTVAIKVKNDTYEIAIGISNGNENQDDKIGEELFGMFEKWEVFKSYFGGSILSEKNPVLDYSEKHNKFIHGFDVMGLVEIKYSEENSKPEIVAAGIQAGIELGYSWGQTFQAVVVPIRVEIKVSFEGTFTFKLEFDDSFANTLKTSNAEIELKLGLDVYGGIGCKLISVGVYGKGEIKVIIAVFPDFDTKQATLNGEIGLRVKYSGLFVKWKKDIKLLAPKEPLVIYQNPKYDVSALSIAELYDDSNYEIATSSFEPQLLTFSLNEVTEEQVNMYDGLDPKMIQVGDLIYIVYHDDLARYNADEEKYYYTSYKDSYNFESYDKYNYQKLVYQIYDTKNQTLSDVIVLDDNGYSDGAYDVYYNGIDVVIAYTQMKEQLDAADFALINNAEDPKMDEYVKLFEVKTAVLNGKAFEVSNNTLTSDEYYDMNLRVGEVNGQITAVWVQNAENTMFGTTDNNNMSIWYSVYNGTTWSAPACLKSGINTITDIEIGEKGVVYVTDTNNDLTTVGADKTTEGYSDRLITVLDMQGNVVLLTTEESAYHDVSYFADEITYYMSNNLYAIDTNAAYFEEAIAELTEDYTVLVDAEGNVKAVLFVNTVMYDEETGADGSNVFAIFCDGENWGAPIQITDFGAEVFVSAFDAVDFDDKIFISALISEVEYSEEVTDEGDNYATINRFETLWFKYPTDIVMEEISYNSEDIIPNTDATFTIKIKNNGYKAIKELPVLVTRNNSDVYNNIVADFYDENGERLTSGILSGQMAYIKVVFNVGEADDTQKYTVTIGEETREEQLWYTDYAVVGKQVLIGDTYHIVVLVTNNGYISGCYNISAICNKEVIWNNNGVAVELNARESKYFIVPLETTIGESSRLVDVIVDAEQEAIVSNNTLLINVSTEEDLSEQVKLSTNAITIDRSMVIDQDFEVSFEDKYILQSILINGAEYVGEYANEGNKISFSKESMAEAFSENGIYTLTFVFVDDSEIEKTSTFVVTMTEFFTITWVVDGKTTYEEYEVGAQLVPIDPSKDADEYYTYTFDGWDKQLQMTVNGDATYTGTFSKHRIQYEITWVVDGNEETTLVNSLELPTHDEPTKESDAEWDYTFVGWSPVIEEATKNCTYTAEFAKSPRKYTVTWNVNGAEVTTEHTYNEIPSTDTPQSYSDNEYFYTFKGWDKEIAPVTKDTVYTAQWNAEPVNYTITWNIDGVKSYSNYTYNQTPEYGSIPTKASSEQYDYVFTGWSPEISAVTADAEYVAQFEAILRQYTVRWIIDGVSEEQELYYGELPTHFNPTKASDAQYDYEFAGWDKEPSVVYGDQEYVAQFTPILRKYTITWIVDGSEYSSSVYYNSMPSFMGLPSREGTAQYSYIFAGWTPEVEIVTGDKTYTAVFEQVVNTYTITWKIGDEADTDIYQYGEIPEFDGALFSEFVDESHCYVFTNWDKEIVAVTQDVTYVASFESRTEHNFTSNVETNEYGIQYTVYTCECGYSYSVIPETTPSISVKSDSTIAGSVAEIEIVVKNNPGVLGAVLTIEYDEDLKLLSAEAGEAWSTLNLTLPGTYDNACSFVWDGVSDVDASDGTILKLRFEVSADASVGDEYGVSVSYRAGSIVGENNTSVAFMTYAGVVNVEEYSYGDVNGDGFIDVTDVILIRQHLAGGYDVVINTDTADVNLDGYVDVTDVILIRQYLAGGYGVVLGQKQN